MNRNRKMLFDFFCAALSLASFLSLPVAVFAAQGLVVTPLIFDDKGQRRDILKHTLTLTNKLTDRTQTLYTLVHDVDPAAGVQKFESVSGSSGVLAHSLANWIAISRGAIYLKAGESKDVPFLIQVDLAAPPGMYHAYISFVDASTPDEAESKIQSGVTVAVNVEVLDNATELLQIKSFVPEKTFTFGKAATFLYSVENIGNRALSPKGEVRIYNSNGEEVASLPVNEKDQSFGPNVSGQLASVWDAGSRFGKFKAMLNVDFGEKQHGSLQDTVYFWLFPWKIILIVLFTVIVLGVLMVAYLHTHYIFGAPRHLAMAQGANSTNPAPSTPTASSPAASALKISESPAALSGHTYPTVASIVPSERHPIARIVKIPHKNSAAIASQKRYVVNLKK